MEKDNAKKEKALSRREEKQRGIMIGRRLR
jgi:hypothetical protein